MPHRISTQSGTIADYERRIALLQLNLAVRVAIEDDEDLVDDSSASQSTRSVAGETPAVDADALQADLAAAVDARSSLEQQLSTVQGQLADAQRQADAAVASVSALDQQLDNVRAEAALQREHLEAAATKAAGHESTTAAARAAAQAAEERLAEVETASVALQSRASELDTQLAAAQEAHASALAAPALSTSTWRG